METHYQYKVANSFWKKQSFEKGCVLEANRHSYSIWFLHHVGVNFSITLVDMHYQAITIEITKGNMKWYCTVVYASPYLLNCISLWEHLKMLKNSTNTLWLLTEGFNKIF